MSGLTHFIPRTLNGSTDFLSLTSYSQFLLLFLLFAISKHIILSIAPYAIYTWTMEGILWCVGSYRGRCAIFSFVNWLAFANQAIQINEMRPRNSKSERLQLITRNHSQSSYFQWNSTHWHVIMLIAQRMQLHRIVHCFTEKRGIPNIFLNFNEYTEVQLAPNTSIEGTALNNQ